MAQTLLDITQTILSAMGSDEVNSISDTVESIQVARIVRNKYYDILSRGDLPDQSTLLQLNPSTDSSRPTLMYVPEGVTKIEWIKYFDSNPADGQQISQFGSYSHGVNADLVAGAGSSGDVAPGYKYVTIIPIQQFIDMVTRFNTSEDNVETFEFREGGVSFTFNYKNNIQPSYCTIIENTYVVFDSFDIGFDSTLEASKIMVYGLKITPFQMVDSFIPDIGDEVFPLLLSECKALAFYELKQMPHSKAEQEIKRQWSTVQKDKSVVNKPSYFNQLADFGRVPRTGGYASTGYGTYKWMRQSGP